MGPIRYTCQPEKPVLQAKQGEKKINLHSSTFHPIKRLRTKCNGSLASLIKLSTWFSVLVARSVLPEGADVI